MQGKMEGGRNFMNGRPFVYPRGCVFDRIGDIRNKRITVMGLGLNGGGEACVRFFLRHGAYVLVTDMKSAEQLKPALDSIAADRSLDLSRLTYRLGGHRTEDFSSADCVIKNPGVKIEGNPYLAAARAIETDISIFLHFSKSPVIAVTGSKGKSSTVSALHYGLNRAGFTAFLGGNITVSPLTFLEKTTENTPVVLELSSWQLADLRGRGALRPRVSVITKIVADHQNWYGNMEDYVADKRLIYADQTAADYSIFDADGDEPDAAPSGGGTWGGLFAEESRAEVLRYSKSRLPDGVYGAWQETDSDGQPCGKILLRGMKEPVTVLRTLRVPGSHIRTNVLNAALAMCLTGVPAEAAAEILKDWPGIEHRLQYFYERETRAGTVKFYNDSCATVPEAAAAASQSFGKPVILIAGGTDKNLAFDALVDTLSGKTPDSVPVKALYLLAGTGTDKLAPALRAAGVPFRGPFSALDDLLRALKSALDADSGRSAAGGALRHGAAGLPSAGAAARAETGNADPPDCVNVVFSPGATSFGMFVNEFDRGNRFMEAVRRIFR